MKKKTKQPAIIKQKILKATANLIVEKSLSSLTLQAIATKAGISKGGLLHYFPNKQILIHTLFETLFEDFWQNVAKRKEDIVYTQAKSACAYIQVNAEELHVSKTRVINECTLIALIFDDEVKKQWARRVAISRQQDTLENSDSINALIGRLAADGLWLSDFLHTYEISPDDRKILIDRLQEIAQKPQIK